MVVAVRISRSNPSSSSVQSSLAARSRRSSRLESVRWRRPRQPVLSASPALYTYCTGDAYLKLAATSANIVIAYFAYFAFLVLFSCLFLFVSLFAFLQLFSLIICR